MAKGKNPSNVLKFKRKLINKDHTTLDYTPVGELTFGRNTYIIGVDPEGFWRLGKVDSEILSKSTPPPEGVLDIDEVCTCGISIHSEYAPPTVFLAAVLSIIEMDMFGSIKKDAEGEKE
jgi:hypothetical protein